VPAQEIYFIERGLRRPRRWEKEQIAEALQVEVEDVFPLELQKNSKIEGMPGLSLSKNCAD
jgi:DNA-binding XRE family transcriptional regulator